MTKKLLLAGLALGCLATVGCRTTSAAHKRFENVDLDRSGKLSLDEVNTYLVTGVFEGRDANGDKVVTRAEWLAGDDLGQERLFRERDANRDGVVSLDEALAYGRKKGMAAQFVREADTDKDGSLSFEEIFAFYSSKEGSVR